MEKYLLAKIFDFNGDLNKRWFVEYKFKHPETKLHKKFREWISLKLLTKQARYAEATLIKNKINSKLKSGFNPFEPNKTGKPIIEAVNEILSLKQSTCIKKAYYSYRSMCKTFTEWVKENKFHTLTPEEFTKQKAYLFLDHVLTARKVSNRTHNCYLICMKTIFNNLTDRDYLEINPFQKIKRLPVKETDLTFITDMEKALIKHSLPELHYQLYCVMLLVYYCFLRPAEIVRLKICDFNFFDSSILVKASKSKNKKNFTLTMPQMLIEALLPLKLENYNQNLYLFSNGHKLTPGTAEIAPTRIAEIWNLTVKQKLMINKNIYDLKATGNGDAFTAGIDARQIQLQNRHHSLEQTQIYLNKFNNRAGDEFKNKMPTF